MSRRTLLLSAFTLTVLISAVSFPRVFTQSISVMDQCRNRMHYELREHLYEFRARIFGSVKKSGSSGYETRTGGSVDQQFRGILETRGRLTSELVEPMIESYRVLRCRVESVCGILKGSFQASSGDVEITDFGCPTITEPVYSECYATGETTDDKASAMDTQSLIQECQTVVTETLAMERAILKMSVTYDSGYRSMLQFTGVVDWMNEGLFDGVLTTTAGTVNQLGKLHQIPCFIGQCDTPDTSTFPTP
ncbi:MAG: hypothetical protein ABL890_03645 [Candidatus Peribacteraceae bacterium]